MYRATVISINISKNVKPSLKILIFKKLNIIYLFKIYLRVKIQKFLEEN